MDHTDLYLDAEEGPRRSRRMSQKTTIDRIVNELAQAESWERLTQRAARTDIGTVHAGAQIEP